MYSTGTLSRSTLLVQFYSFTTDDKLEFVHLLLSSLSTLERALLATLSISTSYLVVALKLGSNSKVEMEQIMKQAKHSESVWPLFRHLIMFGNEIPIFFKSTTTLVVKFPSTIKMFNSIC
jgi:hypothetical protein